MKTGTKTKLDPSVSEEARSLTSGTPSRKPGTPWISSAPLVGRHGVLAVLTQGQRPCTIIFGEPGIGKTRLLAEVRQHLGADAYSVACLPTRSSIPLDPIVALVRAMHRSGRIASAEVRGVSASPEGDRIVWACEALGHAASADPLHIQIDDLHVADDRTLEAVRYCVARLCDLPITWQLASRRSNPGVLDLASDLERAALGRVIHLGGLKLDDLRTLATRLRPHADFDDAQIAELARLTGGNPLYAELLLVAPLLGSGSASSDLRQALRKRIQALSSETRGLAGWLAVNGDALSSTELAVITKRSPGQVAHQLAELTNESVIEEHDGSFRFRHELLREACYELLDESERKQMHLSLAARCKNDWSYAEHLHGAGLFDEAAARYRKIGWESLDCQAPTEALTAFESALERSERLSIAAIESAGGQAAALLALGKVSEAQSAFGLFETNSRDLPKETCARVRTVYAETLWDVTDDEGAALPIARQALEDAPAAPELIPRLHYIIGSIEERAGNLAEASEILNRGIAICERPRDDRARVRLVGWLGVVLARLGKVHESLAMLAAVANEAERLDLPDELARCCVILCYVAHMAGDKQTYEHWCRVGLNAHGPRSKAIEATLRSNLATVAINQGHLKEALGLTVAAEASIVAARSSLRNRLVCSQAQLYAMLGDFEAAVRVLQAARDSSLTKAERRATAFTSGFVDELRERHDDAMVHYRAVIADRDRADPGEVYEVRALSGLVRLTALRDGPTSAEAGLVQLREIADQGWPIAMRSLDEAEGCLALIRGDPQGATTLLQAARQCEYPFWRAHLELLVARLTEDRQLFLEVIESFDLMGARVAADRARGLARALGLRPGRKREMHGALSSREESVAFLIGNGKTNAEIGEILHISSRTVEYHVGNILSKCGLRSRVDIARLLAAGQPLGPPASA